MMMMMMMIVLHSYCNRRAVNSCGVGVNFQWTVWEPKHFKVAAIS